MTGSIGLVPFKQETRVTGFEKGVLSAKSHYNGCEGKAPSGFALTSRPARIKFRRQQPIGACIVEFYCAAARLMIEVDGSIHLGQAETDANRSRELEARGCQVMRFTNEQIETNIENVLTTIEAVCQSKTPLPNLGEGLG
jgi:very-short-patch-repair endonuclease